MRKYFFCAFFIVYALHVFPNVTFRINAPKTVINGGQFHVEFIINDASATNFKGPEFSDFDLKFGPATSVRQSTQVFNNQVSKESSLTFTYTLQAKKEGTFTVNAAQVTVNGKTYTSNTASIKVLPQDKNAPAQSSSGVNISRDGSLGSSSATSQDVSSQDLYLRLITSKQDVYEQECIVATLKLFSRYEYTQTDGSGAKIPDFQGFLMQDIELPQNKSWQIENINGRNYKTVILRQWLLYPQRSGTISIDASRIDAVVGIVIPQRRAFSNNVQEVKKTLTTGAININVKPLPTDNKPTSFSGGVGTFTLSSAISPEKPKANEAITLKLTFQGTGNLKLLKNPEIKFPADFEVYDPKVENDFQATTNGFSGSKTIEYLAIPRHPGKYEIPSVEFSYFDLKSKSYKTHKTPVYKLDVEKGSASTGIVNNFTNQENVKLLGEDIRFIKTGNLNLKTKDTFLFGTLPYYLWHFIPALLFVVLSFIFRKQARENANIALVRTKKANKVANKRLKKAAVYLRENVKEAFYEEILRALWGYLSDKLNMPLSQLSKDNVETELKKYGVEDLLIDDFMEIINTCEFARYAPVNEHDSMEKVYNDTTSAIDKMENTIKKSKN